MGRQQGSDGRSQLAPCTQQKVPIPFVGQLFGGFWKRHPDRGMPGLVRWAKLSHRPRGVDCTQLFSPPIVFGHVGEAPERTDPDGSRDRPSGFLEHLAVQGAERAFAGVNATARQLKLGSFSGLMGHQNLRAKPQNGICARPKRIALTTFHRLTESANHVFAPWVIGCPAYIGGVCQPVG